MFEKIKIIKALQFEADHEQVELRRQVFVDRGLEGLLGELWRLGVTTEYSCRETLAGSAYILFPKPIEGMWFAYFAKDFGEVSISRREFQYGGGIAVDFDSNSLESIELLLKFLDYDILYNDILFNEALYYEGAYNKVPFIGYEPLNL